MLGWIQRAIGYYRETDAFWFCYKCGNLNAREEQVCGKCGEKLLVRMTVEPISLPPSAQVGERAPQPLLSPFETGQRIVQKQEMGTKALGKMFLHGFLFALIYLGLVLAWTFLLVILLSVGSLIGLAIAVGLLVLGIGGINAFLGSLVWNIRADTTFWSVFLHGVVLGIILLGVNLVTSFLPNQIFPGTATFTATFIITSFIDGAVGREVASWFGSQ
jgi:hypothetical protein